MMAECLCDRIGISRIETYPEYTEALIIIHKSIESTCSKHALTKDSFDITPLLRFNYIDARISMLRNNTQE